MTYMVTGAFSFTGRYVTKRLLQDGCEVRTMTRRPQEMNPFSQYVEVVGHDFDDVDVLSRALDGCDRLVNTYWWRLPEGKLGYDRVVRRSQNLFTAAKAVGIERIVHISISDPQGKDYPYFRGKCATEKAVGECGVSHVVVRPQLVFGDGELLINNLAWSLRKSRIVPVPGDGQYLLQPIHAEDYADLIVGLVRDHQGGVVDAVGPDALSFAEMVLMVGSAIGRDPKLVYISPKVFTRAAWLVNQFLKEPTLLDYEVYGCLVDNGLVPRKPQGSRRLANWLAHRSDTLGRRYANQDNRPFQD